MTKRSPAADLASLTLQTPAELEGLRDLRQSEADRLERRGHRIGRAWKALGRLGVLLAVAAGIVAGGGLGGSFTEAMAVAAVSSVFGLAVMLTTMDENPGVVGGYGMVLGATWLTAALAPGLGMASGVPAPAALLAAALLAGVAIVVHLKLEEPRQSALRALARLEELDADRHPEYCVGMVDLCDAHPEVQAFQARIAAMGRRPTVEELEVAERWAVDKVLRDEEASAADTARQACARLNPSSAESFPAAPFGAGGAGPGQAVAAVSGEGKTAFNDDGSLKGAANA